MAALAERARIASANIRADGDGIVRRMPQLRGMGRRAGADAGGGGGRSVAYQPMNS